ncbi:uncharacterized protein LOC121729421 [Aricia agestis]|uniref:uncharacterized protein LOC121729421 n=1 Tax=Aricia agestis TaxID=91739 RepID=UPI001C209601|nr:uncharacterized protein LOC121729421 [Aricia agestis]
MDPIAVLQNRIEQLEAKLGLGSHAQGLDGQHGDSIATNLLNAAQAINNATAGHEKLSAIKSIANELNNYTDPNLVENLQRNNNNMNEVVAAEPMIQHHCHCMQRCKQAAPVLESEPLQQVPQMQTLVDSMYNAANEVKADADVVAQGIQELAETCGAAASNASEQLANVAKKVDQLEEKKFPKRRNGLD